ncbi:hypothetical protein C7S13_4039 [Burkholderia cepacia]|nr:hypothetical protein [Burkholderia cepacia]
MVQRPDAQSRLLRQIADFQSHFFPVVGVDHKADVASGAREIEGGVSS